MILCWAGPIKRALRIGYGSNAIRIVECGDEHLLGGDGPLSLPRCLGFLRNPTPIAVREDVGLGTFDLVPARVRDHGEDV